MREPAEQSGTEGSVRGWEVQLVCVRVCVCSVDVYDTEAAVPGAVGKDRLCNVLK